MIKDEDFITLSDAVRLRESARIALEQAQRAERPGHEIALIERTLQEQQVAHEALRASVIAARGTSNGRFAARHEDFAATYEATVELRTAIRVALTLGRPLLLTGDPGSGKTLAAFWISKLFADGAVLRFQVKSESRAKDLLYSFDAASWFRSSQISNALAAKDAFLEGQVLGKAFGWDGPREAPAVVLIDEIDKAPRDFPNDLLHELDQMSFRIDETGKVVECPADKRPIVVITSNSERQLPPPFLRRCVVHTIELDSETVLKILRARLKGWGVGATDVDFLAAAGQFWSHLGRKKLDRKPTIDEYWRWLALEIEHGNVKLSELGPALSQRQVEKLRFAGTVFSSSDLQNAFAKERPD